MRWALDLPPGLIGDDTSHAEGNRWRSGSNVRFWRKRPEVVGGWESLIADLLGGVCRSILPWSGSDSQVNIAFGTHATLEVWIAGVLSDITPTGLAAGQIDGTGGAGYGTGAYGIGNYGELSTTEFFPRTWSLGAWGKQLVASPRGGTIYLWANNTASPAAALSNAPANVTYMLVAPQDQVFALGCNEEVSGTFNPLCIRHSSIRNNNQWNTATSTTAREYILPGGGRIIAGRVVGNYLLVWTDQALFLGTYIGDLAQPWRFDQVDRNCGLIGPGAVAVLGQTAYWLSTDKQFRAYVLGGAPTIIPCPLRENVDTYLAASQSDKIVASTCAQYGEIRWDYPDSRDGFENSRYLSLCTVADTAGAWSQGLMPRTAYVDAGPSLYPCATTYEGNIFWQELGRSADGAALSWFLKSGDLSISDDQTMMIRGVWPDFKDQAGAINLTLYSRLKPQGDEVEWGPYSCAIGADRVDFRTSGRFYNVLFEGDSSPSGGRFGAPVFDIQPTGAR